MEPEMKALEQAYRVSPVDVAFGTQEYPPTLRRINLLTSCAEWMMARTSWLVRSGIGTESLIHDYVQGLLDAADTLLQLQRIGLRESEGEPATLTLAGKEHVVIPRAEYDALKEAEFRLEGLDK